MYHQQPCLHAIQHLQRHGLLIQWMQIKGISNCKIDHCENIGCMDDGFEDTSNGYVVICLLMIMAASHFC
jgi:hypothetical protein